MTLTGNVVFIQYIAALLARGFKGSSGPLLNRATPLPGQRLTTSKANTVMRAWVGLLCPSLITCIKPGVQQRPLPDQSLPVLSARLSHTTVAMAFVGPPGYQPIYGPVSI